MNRVKFIQVVFFFMLKSQQELNFSQYTDLYDKLIPQNHLFRKINELIDFNCNRQNKPKFTQRKSIQLQDAFFV